MGKETKETLRQVIITTFGKSAETILVIVYSAKKGKWNHGRIKTHHSFVYLKSQRRFAIVKLDNIFRKTPTSQNCVADIDHVMQSALGIDSKMRTSRRVILFIVIYLLFIIVIYFLNLTKVKLFEYSGK